MTLPRISFLGQDLGQFAHMCFFAGCKVDNSKGTMMNDEHIIKLKAEQTQVNFSVQGKDEVVLLIEDEANPQLVFKLAIGASENTVTWLSQSSRQAGNE